MLRVNKSRASRGRSPYARTRSNVAIMPFVTQSQDVRTPMQPEPSVVVPINKYINWDFTSLVAGIATTAGLSSLTAQQTNPEAISVSVASVIDKVASQQSITQSAPTGFIAVILIHTTCAEAVSTYNSTMCFEHALEIHAAVQNKECPTRLLEEKIQPCSYICYGKYSFVGSRGTRCVAYNIIFRMNEISTTLKDFQCNISECNVDFVEFTCWINITSDTILDELNIIVKNITTTGNTVLFPTNELYLDKYGAVFLPVGCGLGGLCLGLIITKVILWIRRRKSKVFETQNPSVAFHRNPQDEIYATADESQQYSDIDGHLKMLAKAIQVPSYKEDTSSSSQGTVYHHLNETEESVNFNPHRSLLFSDDFPPGDYEGCKSVSILRNGSPSLKSVVIPTGSSSSKSNSDTKGSPRRSQESFKYYALEKEYLMLQSDINTD